MKKLLGFCSPYSWAKHLRIGFAVAALIGLLWACTQLGYMGFGGALLFILIFGGPAILAGLGVALGIGAVIAAVQGKKRRGENKQELQAEGSEELIDLDRRRARLQAAALLMKPLTWILRILFGILVIVSGLTINGESVGDGGFVAALVVGALLFGGLSFYTDRKAKSYKTDFKKLVARAVLESALDNVDYRPNERFDDGTVRASGLFGGGRLACSGEAYRHLVPNYQNVLPRVYTDGSIVAARPSGDEMPGKDRDALIAEFRKMLGEVRAKKGLPPYKNDAILASGQKHLHTLALDILKRRAFEKQTSLDPVLNAIKADTHSFIGQMAATSALYEYDGLEYWRDFFTESPCGNGWISEDYFFVDFVKCDGTIYFMYTTISNVSPLTDGGETLEPQPESPPVPEVNPVTDEPIDPGRFEEGGYEEPPPPPTRAVTTTTTRTTTTTTTTTTTAPPAQKPGQSASTPAYSDLTKAQRVSMMGYDIFDIGLLENRDDLDRDSYPFPLDYVYGFYAWYANDRYGLNITARDAKNAIGKADKNSEAENARFDLVCMLDDWLNDIKINSVLVPALISADLDKAIEFFGKLDAIDDAFEDAYLAAKAADDVNAALEALKTYDRGMVALIEEYFDLTAPQALKDAIKPTTPTPPKKSSHSHSWSAVWETDADNHWKSCACGAKSSLAAHTPGEEATCTTAQTCTVCSEELVPATGHTPGAEATYKEPQLCTVCSAVLVPATGLTGPDKIFDFFDGWTPAWLANAFTWLTRYILFGWLWGRWL